MSKSVDSAKKSQLGRRDVIIRAAIRVIADEGIAATTHRKIAKEAKVPLGSVTYYFKNLDELFFAAFSLFAEEGSIAYAKGLEAATSVEEAREAVVRIITGTKPDQKTMGIVYELYAYSTRNPVFQTLMQDWMKRSRKALSRHFDPSTSKLLDALVEGAIIHNSVAVARISVGEVRKAVQLLTEHQK